MVRITPQAVVQVYLRRFSVYRRGLSAKEDGSVRVMQWSPGALIFDMDGLLVDSEPLWHRVEKEFVAARGKVFTDEMALQCTGQGIGKTIVWMGQTLGFPVDVPRDIEELVDLFLAGAPGLSLKPGAREIVEAARGRLPLGLASSSPRRLIEAVLGQLGLATAFQVIVSGQEVARPKPWPDVYLETAKRLGVAPEACLALEDSLNGSRSAHDAGMKVIAVPEGAWEGRGFEAVSDAIVKDLLEARARIALP